MKNLITNDSRVFSQQLILSGKLFSDLIANVRQPLLIAEDTNTGMRGILPYDSDCRLPQELSFVGVLPALYPEWLGDRKFLNANRLRFPYIVGEMARGISSAEMVIAIGKFGMLAMFGAGGVSLAETDKAIIVIQSALSKSYSWGINLIHSPQKPALEKGLVDLCLKHQVTCLSASAFMTLSENVVRYAFKGVRVDSSGQIIRPNRVFVKISRIEVAEQYMSPPPKSLLERLVESGDLTKTEAILASNLPIAENITVEADSGGHTDGRALSVLLPVILKLRNDISKSYCYSEFIYIGAAGGIGTPSSVAAAFTYGASYVVTGSINQSAVESGLHPTSREILADLSYTDMALAPAGDMFEMGAKVQVVKKRTLFPQRANKLYEWYCRYGSIEELPPKICEILQQDIFKLSFDEVWDKCRQRLLDRDPEELERANRDPKHKMALMFRWYLGISSRWGIDGDEFRRLDYQLWCGPSMGAFNDWVKGSFLEEPSNRTVVQIALNLLEGAAVITRAQQCRSYGLAVPGEAFYFTPKLLK